MGVSVYQIYSTSVYMEKLYIYPAYLLSYVTSPVTTLYEGSEGHGEELSVRYGKGRSWAWLCPSTATGLPSVSLGMLTCSVLWSYTELMCAMHVFIFLISCIVLMVEEISESI